MTVPTDEAAPIDGHTPPDGAAHVAAPKAEAVPIAAPVPETAPADEDTLVIPEAWRTQLHPRRGGTPVPAPKRAADQTLDAVYLSTTAEAFHQGHRDGGLRFAALDPLTASETLGQLTRLVDGEP